MNKRQFGEALKAASEFGSCGIGTYMERSQHRALKFFFEPDPSYHEIPVHTYIADICKNGHIYEIQTSAFGNLTSKLEVFLKEYEVSVVYPAAVRKSVIWSDPESGEVAEGRTVTKRSVRFKFLSELLHIIPFFGYDNFSLIVAETAVDDLRLLDGRGKDRKIKATKIDRIPKDILSLTKIENPCDVKRFAELEDECEYTRESFGKKYALKGRNLSAAIKALLLLELICEDRREGSRIIYKVRDNGSL